MRESKTLNYDECCGSGNTTADVQLILRGQGGIDSGHCWLQSGPVGQRDDGGQLTKSITFNGTSHNWGEEKPNPISCLGSKTCGHKWNLTDKITGQLQPGSVRLEVPCEKDARSLHGTKMLDNSKDSFERINYDLSQEGEARTEVELVPPGEYEQWVPQAGETEKALGNFIDVGIVAHTKGDPSKAPPRKVKKYTITLACQWQHNGRIVIGSVYGKDPPGMSICESRKGTGVNDASNPNNKAGDATRGDCVHKFCLRNSQH
jgi:hypothetical protein